MHWIVMRGAPRLKVDRAKLLKACKFVSDMETDFFGDSAPYDHYVWHFAVNDAADGAGGLEHLSSTQISLAQGVGPRAVDVLAHEFFHLWNVKRIRSKVLGPFDYTKLPQTGALWWLEGVTDYYAYLLQHRYGWTDDAAFLDSIGSNVQSVRRTPAYREIGPDESSMRTDEDSAGRGNSNGYHISYYNLGWLAGMCLDIELRSRTQNKHSLDDVEHALWNLCRDDRPGFEEDEIRRQLVKLGGKEMDGIYNRIVLWPDGMQLSETLQKVGLDLVIKPETYVEPGFSFGAGFGATTPKITSVKPKIEGLLQVGDELLKVNSIDLTGDNIRTTMASLNKEMRAIKAGAPIALKIRRAGVSIDVEITPTAATRPSYSVVKQSQPSAESKKLGQIWLATIHFKP
jgi:predicted metalloprotease with PDZ domain